MKLSKNKGFTLIELLVVISIISLLSSIILVTLGNVKVKAKDAIIKTEVVQFEKLLALEYSEKGSYCGLMDEVNSGFWIQVGSVCESSYFTGSYSSQALSICNKIAMSFNNTNPDTTPFYVAVFDQDWNSDCKNNYSIGVYLNSGKFLCASNNAKKEYSGPDEVYGNDGADKGCYHNP